MPTRLELLQTWVNSTREIAETDLTAALFESLFKTYEPIESFSTWMLVGAAAVGAFMISNAEKVIPVVTAHGYLVCGAFLVGSTFFGLLAKAFALTCKIQADLSMTIRTRFKERLEQYDVDEEEFQKRAKELGGVIDTSIRFDKVLSDFLQPAPWYAKLIARRTRSKLSGNAYAQYVVFTRSFGRLGQATALQSLLFLAFLLAGFVYAAAA